MSKSKQNPSLTNTPQRISGQNRGAAEEPGSKLLPRRLVQILQHPASAKRSRGNAMQSCSEILSSHASKLAVGITALQDYLRGYDRPTCHQAYFQVFE